MPNKLTQIIISDPKRCQVGRELFLDPKGSTDFKFQTQKVPPSKPTHFSGESPSPPPPGKKNKF